MVSIARKNLFQDLPRFIVAQAGIMFSVGLVTIQIGILNGFTRSSTVLIENADADIWVTSEELRHLALTLPLEYKQLAEAKEVDGVDRAEPLIAQGLQLIARRRKNMKNTLMTLLDKVLLRKRSLIKTVNDQLNNICQIEHSRHRSQFNFLVNLVSGLIAYSYHPHKPLIDIPSFAPKALPQSIF